MRVKIPSDLSGINSNRARDHFWFVVNVLCSGGAKAEPVKELEIRMAGMAFEVQINGAKVIFHFADWKELRSNEDCSGYAARFKFHYDPARTYPCTWHPFSPISFLDWSEYSRLSRAVHHDASGLCIGNRQTPRGEALDRRIAVRRALLDVYGKDLVYEVLDQRNFWEEAGRLLVSVCVPGARNDILDRGQIQYMGLGVCTISPKLTIGLPWGKTLEPGIHYVECATDYSNILRTVLWCRGHRAECAAIGANAKRKFEECLTGEKLRKWVLEKLGQN